VRGYADLRVRKHEPRLCIHGNAVLQPEPGIRTLVIGHAGAGVRRLLVRTVEIIKPDELAGGAVANIEVFPANTYGEVAHRRMRRSLVASHYQAFAFDQM